MNRPSPTRIVLAASSLACVGLVVAAPSSGAAPTGTFTATVAFYDSAGVRATVAANTPVAAVIAITNTSNSPASTIGSANISLPSPFNPCTTTTSPTCTANPSTDTTGFTATYQAHTLQLRSNGTAHLAKGATITVTAWVDPTGTCTLTPWPVEVRPSTNFSGGTTTDFSGGPAPLVPFLKFTQQPPVATAYNVNMSPAPQVTSYDGCGVAGAPTTVTLSDANGKLSSGSTGSASGNVTTFGSVQFSDFDRTDSLTAGATGYTFDTSNSFLVAEKVQPCNSSDCQPLTLDSQPKTGAVINPVVDSNNNNALVSGSALPQDTSMCGEAGAGISANQISSTIAVDTPVTKTVTFTIAKSLVNAISNNGAPFMSVCMRTPGNDDVTLSDCFHGGVTTDPPCVVSRNKNQANEVIVVSLPAGDPHFNVY